MLTDWLLDSDQAQWRSIAIYAVASLILGLFIFSHYNKMCQMFCEHDYCSPNGFCMLHLYFWRGVSNHGRGMGESAVLPEMQHGVHGGGREFEF